jgi:sugar lactone lactonase YvrE
MNLRAMNLAQRRFVFFVMMIGGILALVAVTWFLVSLTLGTGARVVAVALVEGVSVREFAALPDDKAYPPTVAVAPDGTVYTGSYATGAIWSISADGATVTELPDTRDVIGAVSALAVTADGALIVIDQQDTDPRSAGGKLWRVADGAITPFGADMPDFSAPNDLALDAAGRVYVSDPGTNQVWRYAADGSDPQVFWVPPTAMTATRRAITGLAYDPATDALIITDPELNEIYRAPVAGGAGELLYQHGSRQDPPGFDGVTVTPDGTIYVAALGQNGIARVEGGELHYIVGLFRGASDVEFAAPNRLYVSNFDQASLVIPVVEPQLPFALDVIELP